MPDRPTVASSVAHVGPLLTAAGVTGADQYGPLAAQLARYTSTQVTARTVEDWATGTRVPTGILTRALLAVLPVDKDTVADLLPPVVLLPALWCTRLGDQLHRLRVEAGLTRQDLAEASGVSQGTLRRWERAVTVPRTRALVDVLAALDVSALSLLPLGDWPVAPTPQGDRGLFATWLVDMLDRHQISQSALAQLLGHRQGDISAWMSSRTYPARENWARTARTLTAAGMPIAVDQLLRMQLPERVPAHRLENAGPIARLLVQARLEQRMCREVAAGGAGIAPTQLSAYEAGRSVPAYHVWPRLRAALGLTVEQVTETLLETDPQPRDLPGWVRARRTALGMRNRDLAARLGCHRNTVYRWESRYDALTAEHYPHLANALGCTVAELRLVAGPPEGADLPMQLRELRTRLDLTQRQAAALLGVSQTTISMVENGIRPAPEKVRAGYLRLAA